MRYSTLQRRLFDTEPATLADGTAVTVDCRGCSVLSVLADAGATVTISRVDSADAAAHSSDGAAQLDDVVPDTALAQSVDWPFYHLSVAGGACRYAVIG